MSHHDVSVPGGIGVGSYRGLLEALVPLGQCLGVPEPSPGHAISVPKFPGQSQLPSRQLRGLLISYPSNLIALFLLHFLYSSIIILFIILNFLSVGFPLIFLSFYGGLPH